MTAEQQKTVLFDMQTFLGGELNAAIRSIEGVPKEVKSAMTRAINAGLEYVVQNV